MIKVEKDLNDIPSILKSNTRETAFNQNITSAGFNYGKGLYKTEAVTEKLCDIYHVKCAYCEKDISDDDKHIEHYRPKDTYYWLAYSWDNLLLCCARCNKSKGKDFATSNTPIVYNNEPFSDIHCLGSSYDVIEQPQIINPEKENILDEIIFDRDGRISSQNSRIQHTIDVACKLNRNELVEKRVKLVNGFIKRMEKHYLKYLQEKEYTNFSMFEPEVEVFLEECQKENEFYAFRYFITQNVEVFYEDSILLQKILQGLFLKFI